jgi:Nitrile hydratase beta subunit
LNEGADEPFEEPWQVRAFALTQGVLEATGLERDEFRSRLIAVIGAAPTRPYWESWVIALEQLMADFGWSGG